ncbi:sodium:solute symporter family transporter [Paraglaciecola chathamensis]|jgi:cation/acetate symporter|uniref:Cation/acetate symporter n=1 Tax=Paraglaciecola agarilytica NO2 TaxID=1125747 RepID=A0ABQ0I9Y4_9ALTE|nr:cation/acetate symporter ActP [Paraglaciecola agarilytica]GAC06196.1 cation/acetate symporter [Paraglaciecola agarilytica NO2]
MRYLLSVSAFLFPNFVFAASSGINFASITTFLLFVLFTLGISYWASKRTKSSAAFYTAGGQISAKQNGTAIAGDFMSAASFLGITGLIYSVGFDGLILAVGALAGWPLMLFVISERVRNLGKFTFTDVVSYRLQQRPIKAIATVGSITVIVLYLVAQLVGAGKLIELLFGLSYEVAVLIIGILVMVYVTVGGMLATTWVQIVKATLLVFGVTLMCILLMAVMNFNVDAIFIEASAVHPKGDQILQPGSFFTDPIQAITIAITMMCGLLGLPHVLMRIFTVADMGTARRSMFYASGIMGYFYTMTILIGFSAIILVSTNPDFFNNGELIGGTNMVAIHLSKVLGGDILMGFMSAVAFATILAVVAGLIVAGSAAISHDIYAELICKRNPDPEKELKLTRIAAVTLCFIGMGISILFQYQNVAFIAVMPLVIAASVNFPILILAMFWRDLTTKGAVAGGVVGLISSVALIVLGPKVWVSIVGAPMAIFPYDYPALFTMTAAFITMFVVSKLDHSAEAAEDRLKFDKQLIASELATEVSVAADH